MATPNTTTPTATRKLPPPPPGASRNGNGGPAPAAQQADPNRFAVTSGITRGAEKVLIYADGGAGKTTLAALAPGAIILDVEDGSKFIQANRIGNPLLQTYQDVRDCLHSPHLDPFGSVAIDSVTKFCDLVDAEVVATVPHEKGYMVKRIGDYGYGKEMNHAYDKFLLFLSDCDALIRKGKNVILIAHECTDTVPNPTGEDYIRFEPRLPHPKSGNLKSSIRSRVYEWADHVVYISRDVAVKDGKGMGGDSRTIFTMPSPSHRAKSRYTQIVLPFESADDGSLWTYILNATTGGQQ